jgi:hypothetical protein
MTHVCRIGLALDDVEDGDVAAALARVRRDHAVLGLQQAAHDVEHSCLAHRLGRLCVVAREGRVRRHEEVAARDGYQARDDADEVVVHVARVAQRRRARGQHRRDELVRLLEGRLLDVHAVAGDAAQRAVVEHDDRVGVFGQPPHREHAVVRLHDDVTGQLRVREHAVRLDQLLGEAVVEALEQEAAHSRPGAASNRMQQHEALQRVAAVGLAVDHVHDVLLNLLAHGVAGGPVVAGAGAVLVDVEVLRVVYILVGPGLDGVDDAVLEVEQDGARDVARVVGLIEEDVLAVAALGGKVLEVAILVDAVLEAELLPELAPDWLVSGRIVGKAGAYCCCRTGRPGL